MYLLVKTTSLSTDVFRLDDDYEATEEKYGELKRYILDEGSSDDDDASGDGSSDDSSDDDDAEKAEASGNQQILDMTETNLVAFRRTVYLTIQSSLDFEECAHKLLRMDIKPGWEVSESGCQASENSRLVQLSHCSICICPCLSLSIMHSYCVRRQMELCNMILDCCGQQRTYEKFFGLLAQRFCMIDRKYVTPFQAIFAEQYATVHRLETNKLRNVGKFFSHLLHTDAISWKVGVQRYQCTCCTPTPSRGR